MLFDETNEKKISTVCELLYILYNIFHDLWVRFLKDLLLYIFFILFLTKFIGLCKKCIRNVNHHFKSNKTYNIR